jgi:hypothetical protein
MPDNVVASPYDGNRSGSAVMMKIPNPKPVVLWIKLAKMLNKKISTGIFIVFVNSSCLMPLPNLSRRLVISVVGLFIIMAIRIKRRGVGRGGA